MCHCGSPLRCFFPRARCSGRHFLDSRNVDRAIFGGEEEVCELPHASGISELWIICNQAFALEDTGEGGIAESTADQCGTAADKDHCAQIGAVSDLRDEEVFDLANILLNGLFDDLGDIVRFAEEFVLLGAERFFNVFSRGSLLRLN